MFKTLIAALSMFALVGARPQSAPAAPPPASAATSLPANVTFVKNERSPLDDKGTYSYDIELSDGTKFSQMGNTEAPGPGENETSLVIKGSYSYIAPDGTPVNVMYIANKDGFQPTGDVIPKAGAPAAGATGSSPPVAVAVGSSPPPAVVPAMNSGAAPAPTGPAALTIQ